MKFNLIMAILIFFTGCKEPNGNGKKAINTGGFEIEVPAHWKYKKSKGIDSFVGKIESEDVELHFDWSEMGYANHLAPTIEEYVESGKWEWMIIPPYMKQGITYTSGDVIGERNRILKEKGITDTSMVIVEKIQIPKKEILLEEGSYKAILTYKDTIQEVNIEIPDKIVKYNFEIDTIGEYYRKIIYPKNGFEGMTGVYFQDLNSNFNFNLVGKNLSLDNQKKAIEAYKTIKVKRK